MSLWGPMGSLWGRGGLKGVLEDSMGHWVSYGLIGCSMGSLDVLWGHEMTYGVLEVLMGSYGVSMGS